MSGPEGTPNGVDRLAQIDAQARFVHGRSPDGNGLVLPNRDVLALVEIAKAARELYVEFAKYNPPDLLPLPIQKIGSALARLDSGAAEEDA